jgi:hypothetical protein
MSSLCSSRLILKILWILKSPLNQNLIMILYKSNNNLKVTLFFEGHKENF